MSRLGMLYALEEEAVQHLCRVASEERDDYILEAIEDALFGSVESVF